jgi:hypothetical protein
VVIAQIERSAHHLTYPEFFGLVHRSFDRRTRPDINTSVTLGLPGAGVVTC